ncbi:MAG: hypothetical protein ABSB35_40900, partial [Bryobacteraceae bacterium]
SRPTPSSASAPVPIGASAEVCLRLIVYIPRVPNQPLGSPSFYLGSPTPPSSVPVLPLYSSL